MTFEIGPTSLPRPAQGVAPSRSVAPATGPSFQAALQSVMPSPRVDSAHLSGVGRPPEEVLDAIGVAADRVDELAGRDRELHFHTDEDTGRVVVQVRDLTSGEVIRIIPPSGALTVLSGGTLDLEA
jgi:hypothetical protein